MLDTTDSPRALRLFVQACELESGRGCYNIGQKTKLVRPKEGMAYMEKGCNLGYPDACFEYAIRVGWAGDKDRGEKLMIEACERQSRTACAWLGSSHRTVAGRREYAKQGCDQGDGESCHLAGKSELFDAWSNHLRAADFYDRACKAKYASGCTALAALLESSRELPRDEARSLALRKQRCFMDAENAHFNDCKPEWADEMCAVRQESCAQYAYKLAKGTHGQAKDTKLALRLWKQTCDVKIRNGCWGMSDAYDQGLGVAKSKANARKWLKRACEIPGEEAACEKRARELK